MDCTAHYGPQTYSINFRIELMTHKLLKSNLYSLMITSRLQEIVIRFYAENEQKRQKVFARGINHLQYVSVVLVCANCYILLYLRSIKTQQYCVKQFFSISDRLNTYLRIQSECRKIQARKTPNTDTFYAV